MFFEGFTLDTAAGQRMRTGGAGPPLLLLHGRPQTHAMWHSVAPRLVDRFSVVCPDLAPDRSEAALASDLLALMTRLGHDRFGIAGHDLGGHVACRMALEAPERVSRLATLEIVPVPEHMNRTDMAYSLSGYTSCWFGQLHPKPEAIITHAPEEWFRADEGGGTPAFFHPEAVADYLRAGSPPGKIQAGDDPAAMEAPPALPAGSGRRLRLTCPMLVIWGIQGRIGGWYDPRQLWRECVDNVVTGGPVPAGHFLAEEAPDMVAAALRAFFSDNLPHPISQNRSA